MQYIRDTLDRIAYVVAAAAALVALYAAAFGSFDPAFYRPLSVMAGVAIVLFSKGAAPARTSGTAALWLTLAVDCVLLASCIFGIVLFIRISNDLTAGIFFLSPWDIVGSTIAIIALLELTRRVFGWPIAVVSLLAVAFVLLGQELPGALHHRGFSLDDVVTKLWYSYTGIFGLPTSVVLNYVLIFIVFGAVLEASGAGDRLMRIVFAVLGKSRGGPAHAAIAASCLFGTMSGSVTANVVGTGAITIPIIKRYGFSPAFAGGVEASASAAGQLMPPVMGATAFLMVELTGIPYLTICLAALMPALVYYGSLFVSVALESRRIGAQTGDQQPRERLSWTDILWSLQFAVPICVVIGTMASGSSISAAGFWATLTALAGAVLNPDVRRNPKRILDALVSAGRSGAILLVAAGALGVIVGSMDISGLGVKFANAVLAVSETDLVLALVMTAGACLLLGMGMPTLPAYLIIILIMGPAIEKFGVPTLAIHLFVLYFGILSNVTPPVAIAAYAAAPIAGASPTRIGVVGLRLSAVGFLVPFFFVFSPEFLLGVTKFDAVAFVWSLVRLFCGIWLIATALGGYEGRPLGIPERLVRAGIAFLVMFVGGTAWQVVALIGGVTIILGSRFVGGREKASEQSGP